MAALENLTSAITTLLSISFLMLTFFIGKYEENKFEPSGQRDPYYIATWFVNASIIFSAISLISSISVHIGCIKSISRIVQNSCVGGLINLIGLTCLALAILAVLSGAAYLNLKIIL